MRFKSSESCSLVGVGSVGKSNLLHHLTDPDVHAYYLSEQRASKLITIVIDPNLLGPTDESSLQFKCWAGYELLMHRLFLALHPFDMLGEDAKSFSNTYRKLQDGTNPLYAYMGLRYFELGLEYFFRRNYQIVFLFDEFEELQQRVESGRLSPDIFTFLRNLMQHETKVDFVFSGTHKLEQLGAEYWSVLFNIAVYKPITFLSNNEIRNLILEPIKDESIEYDPFAIKRISHVAAGHPYFTQLILHEMITYYNETERTYITPTDVDTVLGRIVERGEAHFKYIWAESSEEEQIVLRAFTELLVGAEAVNIKDLKKFLAERGHQWDEKWDEALLSVQSRDIITSRTAKSALYRFKVDLIRLWIDHTRPSL